MLYTKARYCCQLTNADSIIGCGVRLVIAVICNWLQYMIAQFANDCNLGIHRPCRFCTFDVHIGSLYRHLDSVFRANALAGI
jgi:hypothetical protein